MLKDINLLGFYVTDVDSTLAFYSALGFKTQKSDENNGEASVGSMKLFFMNKEAAKTYPESFQKEAFGEPKGTGIYINVEVENIDAYYESLKQKGLTPSSSPRDWPWGHREFVIRDPDRYKLVFYQKLSA